MKLTREQSDFLTALENQHAITVDVLLPIFAEEVKVVGVDKAIETLTALAKLSDRGFEPKQVYSVIVALGDVGYLGAV